MVVEFPDIPNKQYGWRVTVREYTVKVELGYLGPKGDSWELEAVQTEEIMGFDALAEVTAIKAANRILSRMRTANYLGARWPTVHVTFE